MQLPPLGWMGQLEPQEATLAFTGGGGPLPALAYEEWPAPSLSAQGTS